MKKYLIILIIAFSLTSCAPEIQNGLSKATANTEISQSAARQQNLWPTDANFHNTLHSPDRQFVLQYYRDDNNFRQYTDTTQQMFARTTLMGKLTYDRSFLQQNLASSEFLLGDIFAKNLPCHSCIVRIILAAEENNTIQNSNIPTILANNEIKIQHYLDNLRKARQNLCSGRSGLDTNLDVTNFEAVVLPYINN